MTDELQEKVDDMKFDLDILNDAYDDMKEEERDMKEKEREQKFRVPPHSLDTSLATFQHRPSHKTGWLLFYPAKRKSSSHSPITLRYCP